MRTRTNRLLPARFALTVAASFALGACDGDVASPGAEGGLVLTVTSAQVTADQGRLHIEGPTNRTVTLSPGESREIDLPAGTYSVALEGLSGGTVVGYWERGSVTVTDGRQTSLTVSLAAFQASTPSAAATAVAGQPLTVTWSTVSGAASYDVEVSASSSFTSLLDQQNVSGTSAQFTVSQSGTVYFRVRARTRFGGVGNYGQPSSGTLVRVPVQRVEIDPEFSQVDVGQTVALTATAYGPSNEVLTGRSVTWTSVTPGVAEVNSSGVVRGLAPGEAEIVALIEGVEKSAFVVVNDPNGPQTAAPTPTYDAADVISLFSDAYTNVPVDTWSAGWDAADVLDVLIQGNATKRYTNLVVAGIEFLSPTIDATGVTHFRMDLWTPNETAGGEIFRIKLVDFGADGAFGGGDDVEHELTFDATTTPALATGAWITFEIPLSAFQGMTTRSHVAQLIFSGDLGTVYIDNVLFYNAVGAPAINSYDILFAPVISQCGPSFRDFRTTETLTYADNEGDMAPGRTFQEPAGGTPTGVQSQWREEGATDWKAFGYTKGWTPDGGATGTTGRLTASGSTCWNLQNQPTFVDFRVRVQDASGNWSPWYQRRLDMPFEVTVTPGNAGVVVLNLGQSQQFTAQARDVNGFVVPGDPINWASYVGSAHATVTAGGVYTANTGSVGALDWMLARAGYVFGVAPVQAGYVAGSWHSPQWNNPNINLTRNTTVGYRVAVYAGREYALRTGPNGSGSSGGDLDLYIRFGQAPTLSTYDDRSFNTGLDEEIVWTASSDGVLYVLLHAYGPNTSDPGVTGARFSVTGDRSPSPSNEVFPSPPAGAPPMRLLTDDEARREGPSAGLLLPWGVEVRPAGGPAAATVRPGG